jgi:hypothetical protein
MLDRSGVILFRVHPAISQNVTPLVIRTMNAEREWRGYASVITPDRILMVRLGRPDIQ